MNSSLFDKTFVITRTFLQFRFNGRIILGKSTAGKLPCMWCLLLLYYNIFTNVPSQILNVSQIHCWVIDKPAVLPVRNKPGCITKQRQAIKNVASGHKQAEACRRHAGTGLATHQPLDHKQSEDLQKHTDLCLNTNHVCVCRVNINITQQRVAREVTELYIVYC